MRAFLVPIILVVSVSLQSVLVFAKQKNNETPAPEKSQKTLTVAIVPYADAASPQIDDLIAKIEKNLGMQKGIRVLEQGTTNDILNYYLTYIDNNSRDSNSARLLREAREAYLQTKYDEASKDLSEAESHIKDRTSKGESNALLPELLILKAKLAYVGGSKGDVNGIYDEIVQLNPELTFPEGLYSNWERKALAQAKQKLAPVSTASIEITSDPINSEVYVNGIRKGVTYYDKPLSVSNYPPGEHCVEIKTIHYEPYTNCFSLSQGETKVIKANLKRISHPAAGSAAVVSPQRFGSASELSELISELGYYMGVDKIILVHKGDDASPNALTYQIGDASLGAVNKPSSLEFDADKGGALGLVTKEMRGEMKKDVLANPGDELISQSVGSIQLQEQRRKPLYKRPLFWILTGAGAAGGGIAAVLLGIGAAAATTGGLLISF